MPPFTVPAAGTTHCEVPVVGRVNCVGPWYGGLSVLLTPLLLGSGWVMVLVGHCTRNDCAMAGSAHRLSTARAIDARVLDIRPPPRRARRACGTPSEKGREALAA